MMYGLGTNAAGAKPAENTSVSKTNSTNTTTLQNTYIAWLELQVVMREKAKEDRLKVKWNFGKIK
jgi:hypothetical protein